LFLLFARVFSIVLALIAISKSYVDFKGRKESVQMFLLWTVIWIGIVFVAMFPDMVATLVSAGGGSVGIGTFLGMVIVFLFFLVYRMYVRTEAIQQKLAAVVQEFALRDDWKVEEDDAGSAIQPTSQKSSISSD